MAKPYEARGRLSGGFYTNLAKPDEARGRLSGGFYTNMAKPYEARDSHHSGGFYTIRSENGEAKTPRYHGGFYPSAMGSILTTGPFFATAALLQGRRLISNNTARMRSRANRRQTTRKNKRI